MTTFNAFYDRFVLPGVDYRNSFYHSFQHKTPLPYIHLIVTLFWMYFPTIALQSNLINFCIRLYAHTNSWWRKIENGGVAMIVSLTAVQL